MDSSLDRVTESSWMIGASEGLIQEDNARRRADIEGFHDWTPEKCLLRLTPQFCLEVLVG